MKLLLASFAFLVFLLASCSNQGNLMDSSSMTGFESAPESASLKKLKALLRELNYEGIGISYESDATLDLMITVFSDKRAKNREIRLFYTGLAMSYDTKAQSLTIGGVMEAEAILQYIQKNVPARKVSTP